MNDLPANYTLFVLLSAVQHSRASPASRACLPGSAGAGPSSRCPSLWECFCWESLGFRGPAGQPRLLCRSTECCSVLWAPSPGGSNAKDEAEQMKNLGASAQVPSSKMQLFVLWRATSPPSLEQSSYCKPAFVLLAGFTKLASHLQFLILECHGF